VVFESQIARNYWVKTGKAFHVEDNPSKIPAKYGSYVKHNSIQNPPLGSNLYL
jgi:hypothetical protein